MGVKTRTMMAQSSGPEGSALKDRVDGREYNAVRMRPHSFRLIAFLMAGSLPMAAAACDALRNLSLPGATIDAVQSVGAGEFAPPQGGGAAFKTLPAFCRVSATLRPVADSQIGMEVWLPASGWNGNLQS